MTASYSEPVGSNLRRDFQLDDLILVIKSYAIEELLADGFKLLRFCILLKKKQTNFLYFIIFYESVAKLIFVALGETLTDVAPSI